MRGDSIMKKYAIKPDKRELLLVIGKLAGEIEQTVYSLEKVLPLLQSLHFHFMCVEQMNEATKTWEKFIRFVWLAANWKIHSLPKIEEEISKISVSKFLEVIYHFALEVDQGIKDLQSTAEWLIENAHNDEEYPLEGDEILKSISEATLVDRKNESANYLKYAEMVGYSSEAERFAYECLVQANNSMDVLREFIYFIELAIESFDPAPQSPVAKEKLPLFEFCPHN
ncbi:MAG: hypothetical protein UR51_C0002G0084 [Candidatus Moranbacteria bacterium GW2011_GWF1_34_10]|nr:MAG: hypothetical protein UR51_C0002G0084 [Candidatus Moranbacteria bacterium GW2011_GWF1_34_10]